jgi:hypothetical protein
MEINVIPRHEFPHNEDSNNILLEKLCTDSDIF